MMHLERRIGGGASGTTYLASWQGAPVAVKVASSGGSGLELEDGGDDAHHAAPPECGAVHGRGGGAADVYCLVLEYCEAGDVRMYLDKGPTPPGFFWRVAEGVALGMAYLHKRDMLHRDLKCSNVLLSSDGGVKLTDFGLAVQIDQERSRGWVGAAEIGTFRWMAPEVARREGYHRSADVYSFAMVLFELLTHQVPFSERPAMQAAAAVALHGVRPPLPTRTPPAIASIVTACWAAKPSQRPSFRKLVTELAAAKKALDRRSRVARRRRRAPAGCGDADGEPADGSVAAAAARRARLGAAETPGAVDVGQRAPRRRRLRARGRGGAHGLWAVVRARRPSDAPPSCPILPPIQSSPADSRVIPSAKAAIVLSGRVLPNYCVQNRVPMAAVNPEG